jgi:hypothetical protein
MSIKSNYILIALLLLIISVPAQESRQSNLADLITQIRNALPPSGSYGFVVPTETEKEDFRAVVQKILAGDYAEADTLAQPLGYRLYEWQDTGFANRIFYVLMEPTANVSGGVEKGWGTYFFYPEGFNHTVIEVPHPYWDTNTWKVGFYAIRWIQPKYFLMAGTHRYANGSDPAPADVAHNTMNMFYVVHQEVAPLCVHSMQVHGYSRNSNPNYANYPDVVISNGSSNPTPILTTLANFIESAGYTAGVFNGSNYVYLGATTNTEGQWSRANGLSFIHVELEYFIRSSQPEWENILDAFYYTFYAPLALPGEHKSVSGFQLLGNYPNPFNPETRIRFSVNKTEPVRLRIFNPAGQTIYQSSYGTVPAGVHELSWNGRNLNNQPAGSGVYFYQVEAGTERATGKMIKIE